MIKPLYWQYIQRHLTTKVFDANTKATSACVDKGAGRAQDAPHGRQGTYWDVGSSGDHGHGCETARANSGTAARTSWHGQE